MLVILIIFNLCVQWNLSWMEIIMLRSMDEIILLADKKSKRNIKWDGQYEQRLKYNVAVADSRVAELLLLLLLRWLQIYSK